MALLWTGCGVLAPFPELWLCVVLVAGVLVASAGASLVDPCRRGAGARPKASEHMGGVCSNPEAQAPRAGGLLVECLWQTPAPFIEIREPCKCFTLRWSEQGAGL